MDFAAGQPRTVLRAQDERTGAASTSSDPPFFAFPIWCGPRLWHLERTRSGIVLDSRARFGSWDFGVNRRRVLRWVHDLQQITMLESGG